MFISYATEYDLYKGEKGVDSLRPEQQDELIRAVFDPSKDFRAMVVSWNLIKAQVEGLWSVAVAIGCALESARQIRDFTERTEADIDKIIGALSGTTLWLRLEEAYSPFDALPSRTPYNWKELEAISQSVFASFAGEPLTTVKTALFNILKGRPLATNQTVDGRMPYHAFKHLHDEGKWEVLVDSNLAKSALSAEIVKSTAPILGIASIVAGLSVLVVWYYFGLLLAVVPAAIGAFLYWRSRSATASAIRDVAIGNRASYRWLLSRNVIQLRKIG